MNIETNLHEDYVNFFESAKKQNTYFKTFLVLFVVIFSFFFSFLKNLNELHLLFRTNL